MEVTVKKYDLEDRLVNFTCDMIDFIHKMGIVLKELKECRVALKIIIKKGYLNHLPLLIKVNQENSELIAIIAKSTATAKKNLNPNLMSNVT